MPKIIAKPYTIGQALKVLTASEVRMGLTFALGVRFRAQEKLFSATAQVMPKCKDLTPEQIRMVERLFPPEPEKAETINSSA